MAWISIHDHLVGGKLRILTKELRCSRNESIGILVSLWLWGIKNADKKGFLKGADKQDIEEVVSQGLAKSIIPKNLVDKLIEHNWIDEDEDGNLYLHDWDKWQEQWYKFLEKKEYDANRKKEAYKKKSGAKEEQKIDVSNDSPVENPTDNPTENPGKQKKSKKSPKVSFAEYVKMQQTEFDKLVDEHGIDFTNECIKQLNLYKGRSGKTYKEDYLAILSWVVDKVTKDCPHLIARKYSQQTSGNPFEEYR